MVRADIEYTLRVTVPLDDYILVGDTIEEVIQKCSRFSDYFFHFEIGDKTEAPHLQGWVLSDYAKGQWDNTRDNKLRSYLSTNFKNRYSLASMTYTNYKSYIAKNPTKTLDTKGFKVWTSYDADVLESLPDYVKGGDEGLKKKPKPNWCDTMFETCKETCVMPTLVEGEFRIDYAGVRNACLKSLHNVKGINETICCNLLNTVTLKLENEYPNRWNKRLRRQFNDYIEEKYSNVYFEPNYI